MGNQFYSKYELNVNAAYLLSKKDSLEGVQMQPPRGALRKRCSQNMHQIYKRTPMPKCDFNKVAFQLANLLKSHFGMGVLL